MSKYRLGQQPADGVRSGKPVLGEPGLDEPGLDEPGSASQGSKNASEADLVRLLRQGDELAFTTLVDRYHASMVRIARSFVSSDAAAEDVAGDTWLAVVQGLERFEGRSTVKTWLFHILANRARSRGVKEARSVPFSSLDDEANPAVNPDRFLPAGGRWAGYWSAPPCSWSLGPESSADSARLRRLIARALDQLPASQQAVVTLRDVQGLTGSEVCDILQLSEANQRVLLHRGRAKMRLILETVLKDEQA